MKKANKRNKYIVEEPNGISITQLVFLIKKNVWYFVIFGITGLLIGFAVTKIFHRKYSVTSTLLVNTNNTEATLTSVPQQPDDGRKHAGIQNQIGILNSFTINYQTLKNLKWDITWYKNSFLAKTDLYKNYPYQISKDSAAVETTGIPLHIMQLNSNEYAIACNDIQNVGIAKRKIKFTATSRFGKPFKNQFFSFTLNKIPGRNTLDGDNYTLIFNDQILLTQQYQKDLKITTSDDAESNMLTIELEGRQPDRIIDYLNELGRVYINYGLKEKNRIASNTVDFINRQITGVADSLQSTGASFTNYRSDKRIVDIGQQSASTIQSLGKLQDDEAALKTKLEYFRNLKSYLNNASAMKSLVAPSVVGVTDPALNNLVVQLSDLFRQREVLSYTAQEKSPQLISLNNEIKYTQGTLSENLNNLLGNIEIELKNIQQQKQSIAQQQADIPKTEQNLNNIKRSFDLNNDLYTYLLKKRSEAQIAEASRDPDAKVLDAANLGTTTLAGLNPILVILLGLATGVLSPLIYIVIKMFFQKRLVFVTDVTTQLQLSVVGNILYNKYDNELPVVYYPHSEITESFRGLRINIQHLLKDVANKVIAVHSAIEGEGKTFVSANLAAILALNHKSVLLIDADLRKSRTHEIFSCSNDRGLSDYLNHQASLNDVVVPLSIRGLSIVNSGPKPAYPSELLNNGRLIQFIEEAKEHYEYVIFNNPPLSIVNDAMTIVPYCDMNIFLLRMRSSTRNEVMYINDLARNGIINNMVVAINNITMDSYALDSKSRHGYYNDNRLLN